MERALLFVMIAALLALGMPAALHAPCGDTLLVEAAPDHDEEAAPLRLYAAALHEIRSKAFFPGDITDASAVVDESLKTYLAAHDRYSALLSRDEYMRFRQLGARSYAGIGMDLSMQRDGTVLCEPVANGPAQRAGIRSGDRLVAIDGVPVQGKPLPVLAALAAGAVGTRIALEVVNTEGATRHVQVTRARLDQASVTMRRYGPARVIELPVFTPDTRQQLAFILSQWPASLPVIIDLRGCGGGDFHAAIDSSMLLLKHGENIVRLIRRAAKRAYTVTTTDSAIRQPVVVWQDEATASAAEVFIAALTDNARATSIGLTSAGKGSRQDVIELPGGAALVLTTGHLATPHEFEFDGLGLAPAIKLTKRNAATRDYLAATSAATSAATAKATAVANTATAAMNVVARH